jgi:PAS domain S-box-containing protein
LLDGLPVGAYTCDNHGLITYFNRKAVELWGREPQLNDPTDRFCGSHRLFSSDGTALKHDQCWMARALQSDTEYFGEEIIVERPDGKRVTVLAHANPIHDASGKLVGGVNCLVDIGDRILADESRALLASIVESSDDAIVSKTLDGTILSWNSGAERLFGYTAAEAVGQSINLIVPSDRREEEQDILRRLRHGERIEHYETFRRSKTGQLVEISLCISPIREARTGTIIGASKVARDIGERKRWAAAQVALQDELMEQLDDLERLQEMSVRLFSTRDLQPILEEILVTAATLADTDMGVLYLSDPARGTLVPGAQLGFDEKFLAEIERQPTGGVTGACHEEGRRIVVEDVMTDPRFEAMRPAALRAGIRAVHSTPLITRSGVRVGVLSTHYREPHRPTPREQHLADLCARQAVDFIESARLYGQLLDADRSKNEFLAVLAHELRNPLAPIRNATRILRLAPARSTASASALETIERQMSMMTRLIDDLLDLGRITGDKLELRRQPLEVAEILRVAVETSGPAIDERGLQLDIQGPPAETVVFGDMTRLSQVISNLLDNASKFTAAGGRIWLTARREGDEAIITVKDNGIGIAAEALADIFEMFAQANSGHTSEHRGLGIGLSLVRRLVALHGGSVRVSSEGPAKGSVFEVRLPLFHPSSVESVEPDADPQSLAETTTRRVLVVEDNQDSASTMKTLLGLMGHTVMTAHDGVAALAAAQEFRPDVILLDIGIPLLNGLEVAKRIRTEIWGKDVILIATTGWSTKQDMERSRQEGFDHHLVKPVDLDLLQNLIQSPRATRAATDDSQAPIQTA